MKKILFTLIFTTAYLQSDYLSHPKADLLINELVNEHGFEENFVKEVLSVAKKKQKIIDSISKPAEFTWTWDRYKKLFIEEKRIKNGKIFISENIEVLEKAEKDFGVPKEVITAIIGVETRYGKIQGSYRVIDSLLTLGFDYPRRSKFFRKELVNFFLLTRENELDILDIKAHMPEQWVMVSSYLQVIELTL